MRTIVITGGNGDIAKAIKEELAPEYKVYTPNRYDLDVTDVAMVAEYFGEITPDVLINNAGYVLPMSIASCDIHSEKKAIDINLFGTFNCTAAVLRGNPEAKIINIGSSAATKVHGTWSSYCASKAAVVMATKCWAEDGYDAICVSPGRTATKMRRGLYPNEDPNTLLEPQDFAKVIRQVIDGKYEKGSHLNVTVDNIGEYLK